MSRNKTLIAITTGDHRGIGPEVIAKGIHKLKLNPLSYVIFGQKELYKPFKRLLNKPWVSWSESDVYSDRFALRKSTNIHFVEPSLSTKFSRSINLSSFLCGRYIELAVQGCLKSKFSAVVTGPIDKTELQKGGYHFDGHTEMLKELTKSSSVTMMMSSPKLTVSLATTHVALKDVSATLTKQKVDTCILNTANALRNDFAIKKPKIAVLGLNPHASDQGLFGSEEKDVIEPSITYCKSLLPNIQIDGPFPSDGFFGLWNKVHSKTYDAVICMYHDQALIPIKLLDFDNGVNVTLGLPIVRTSVDHGIGLDIAGKNKANPKSFVAAIELALRIAKRRAS